MLSFPEIVNVFRAKADAAADAGHPSSCHWSVTFRCNASCAYCYARDNSFPDLDTDSMFEIADKLAAAGVTSLAISGGEPFLRKDILALFEHAMEKDFFWITVLTNGTCFSEQHLRFLAKHAKHFNAVRMPVFSLDSKLNDRILGISGGLECVIDNGKRLIEAGIPVSVSVNAVPETVTEIADIHAFFKDLGFVPAIGLKRLVSDKNREEVNLDKYGYDFFAKCLEALPQENLNAFLDHMDNCLKGVFCKKTLCGGLKKEVSINPDGSAYPCQLLQNVKIGNLLESPSLSELLLGSEEYSRIRKLQATDLTECAACKYFYFCNLCIGERGLDHGDVRRPREMTCQFARVVHDYLNRVRKSTQ